MRNIAKEMYERKEYWWFAFYIFLIVGAARFAGAIGAVVSVLVATGLYTTLKNNQYSVGKKVIFSILYVVSGIVAGFIAINVFVGSLTWFMGERAVDSLTPEFQEAQSRELVNESFKDHSTSESISTAPSTMNTSNLEGAAYVDSSYGFSIRPPKGWLTDTSGTNATVEFGVPTNDEIALITVNAELARGYDLQTYAKSVIQGFFSSEGGPNSNLKIISEGNTTLAGVPAYQFEVTSEFTNNAETYPLHGTYVVAVHSDIGYVIFASSFEKIWSKYRDTFNASIASFKFPL